MKTTIKSLLMFPLTLVFLAGCNKQSSPKKYSVYLDNSEVDTGSFVIATTNAYAYGSVNYNLTIYLSIKNTTSKTIPIDFKNPVVVKESNKAKYTVTTGYYIDSFIESGITEQFYFSSTIPTSLDEQYYFSITFNDVNYEVRLYETPDELREDLTISYFVNDNLVNIDSIKKGRKITHNFVYESEDHLSYAVTWKDSNGTAYQAGSTVNENLVLYGNALSNVSILTTSSDTYSFVNSINHVPNDGILVVAPRYYNKEICINNYAIYNNSQIREIYLPNTIHHIYNGNFDRLANLSTIHYAGTESEWNAIPTTSTIPSSVTLVFNSSFSY